MFTHPALLRELNQVAELLRREGEPEWARRVVQGTEALRKAGWTEEGRRHVQGLFEGRPSLADLPLGEHRLKLAELTALPVRTAPSGPRRRSPDLAPSEEEG